MSFYTSCRDIQPAPRPSLASWHLAPSRTKHSLCAPYCSPLSAAAWDVLFVTSPWLYSLVSFLLQQPLVPVEHDEICDMRQTKSEAFVTGKQCCDKCTYSANDGPKANDGTPPPMSTISAQSRVDDGSATQQWSTMDPKSTVSADSIFTS